jgi:hypothetical protein
MNVEVVKPTPDALAPSAQDEARAIFGGVINRLLDGDFKDGRNERDGALDCLLNGDMKDQFGPDGLTFIQEIAKLFFEDPAGAAKFVASNFGENPSVKAMVERAAALNAPKRAVMDLAARCKERGGFARRDYKPGQVAFHFDLPYVLMPLDKKYGPHTYMPCNRDYAPLGELGKMTGGPFWCYEDYPERAWHFRRDPREIEGAWLIHRTCCTSTAGGTRLCTSRPTPTWSVTAIGCGACSPRQCRLGPFGPEPEW